MSGGHWNYRHDDLFRAAADIEKMVEDNPYGDDAKTLHEMLHGALLMRRAAIYWRRIDWLTSGDDGAATFLKRLSEELAALERGTFTYEDPYQ